MKIRYSIAVSTPWQLAELPDLKQVDSVELSSAMRSDTALVIPPAWKKRLFRMSCRMEAGTINALIDSGSAMSRDFYRMFSDCCADCIKFNMREISLGIDWENTLSDPEYVVKLREILRCCFGIAMKYQLAVLLEIRIPGIAAVQALDFLRFRDSLLFPVRTLVNFHPHEPGALELMEEFSSTLPFEVSKFRVSFDAANGNYMTPKLLEKIKTSLRPVGKEIPELCFYPGSSADRYAFAALETVMA